METIVFHPHKTRFTSFIKKGAQELPAELASPCTLPENIKLKYPLPFRKRDITCFLQSGDVIWFGSSKGAARYCENEKEEYDRVMYFAAERDLQDNNVTAIYGTENEVYIETEKCVSHIVLKEITAGEKAEMLEKECLEVVYRQGMISNKDLEIPYDLSSKKKFSVSDNDGGFTCSFTIGELMHYAVLKREKGAEHPDTVRQRKIATHLVEACLLTMYISGRDDGFVARTFITSDAPLPDDGIFLKKHDGKATVQDTTYAREKNLVGFTCDCSAKIPDRLAAIYRDLGYKDDDIIFKGDTSSDEITLHVVNCLFAHEILGEEDKELDSLIKHALSSLAEHIAGHEHELIDFHGGPTAWAKWSTRYFAESIGWGDAPLNAAEVLMYFKVAAAVCPEDPRWQKEYEKLIKKGYPELTVLHYNRAFSASIYMGCQVTEDIMYGDHMLANLSFFGLMMLEKDEELRKVYYNGWKDWRDTSIGREHHPVYDIPFAVACPEDYVDGEKLKMWFNRSNPSRLAARVSLKDRTDVAVREFKAGYEHTSYLLPPDEREITKYDRDPLKYENGYPHGATHVETASPYTTPYWMGRYYGLIKEGN